MMERDEAPIAAFSAIAFSRRISIIAVFVVGRPSGDSVGGGSTPSPMHSRSANDDFSRTLSTARSTAARLGPSDFHDVDSGFCRTALSVSPRLLRLSSVAGHSSFGMPWYGSERSGAGYSDIRL